MNPTIFNITGILMIILTLSGLLIAYKIRRPIVFRLKLALVYSIPLILSITYLYPYFHISHTYRMYLVCTFMFLLQILYWREVRCMTSSVGYHRSVLINFLDMIPDMVWMKDKDNKYTYTNKATLEGLLLCDSNTAFNKTRVELSDIARAKGLKYNFGETCETSDMEVMQEGKSQRFLEMGLVNDKFLALQIFKAPLFSTDINGNKTVIGTIGLGRDLTYDYLDHEEIGNLCDKGDIEEAILAFNKHRDRYKFN